MSEIVVWIDPDGTETALPVEWNANGRHAPPVEMEEDGVPGQPGTRLRQVRHGPRDFVLPLWVDEVSASALAVTLRALVRAMNPLRGPGIVRCTTPVGDQREIPCTYKAGLEMVESLGDTSGPTTQRAPVVFRAHDPYWRDPADTIGGPWTVGASPGSFFPFFPLRLSSSEIFASVTVTNAGDVESWPVWTIVGPGSAISLRNFTTGKVLTLSTGTLAVGDTVTIDTRPGGLSATPKTVRHSSGANWYPNLSAASAFWSLATGANSVSVEMGGTTAASSVSLAYRQRYLGV